MIENQYLSFYIYYAEPWETLLLGAVHPLVKKLVDKELITQYFFIRYWEKGPHLRLRLKKKPTATEAEVSKIVFENLNNFILKYPSKLLLTTEMEARKLAESWRDNNQVRSISYQPETARYGGRAGLPLAELQFFASSRMVLNELIETPNWSYDYALGAAIKLHLGFIFSTGMSQEDIVKFFEKNCQDWLPRAAHDQDKTEQQEQILSQFEKAYSAQKSALFPYVQAIWEELKKNPTGSGSPSWENWLSVNQAVYSNLNLLAEGSLLEFSSGLDNDLDHKLWNILSDFVHMTNNRLGVLNRDEGFLAFMLAKVLKELKKSVT